MLPFNPDLKISEEVYNDNSFSSRTLLANARLTSPQFINSAITYAYGSGGKYGSMNFPMLYNLDGMGRKKAISSLDLAYYAQMYGKPKTTDTISHKIPNQGKAGQNGSFVKLAFKFKFFMRNQFITAGSLQKSVTLQIYGDPVNEAGKWVYTAKIVGRNMLSYVPDEFLSVGAVWAAGVVKVGQERSRGTDHRQPQTPFRLRNQLSLIRRSYNLAGNIANKKIVFDMTVDGKRMQFWTDWEMYVNDLLFKQEKNEDLIFSTYNADKNGVVHNIDSDTQEVVTSGMGMWEQIPNTLEYNMLTETKIDDFISVMFYNNHMSGNNQSGDYVIVGGSGLLSEIDKAMKRSSSGFLTLTDKFIRGKDSMNLQFGAYFTEYLHPTGRVIKFVHDPAFDFGARAKAAPRHPIHTNRSILSYCGMALDFSLVDVTNNGKGAQESNIVLTYEEGREYSEWYVLGGAQMPNMNMDMYKSRATDIDASGVHMMCTQGVHLNYPNTCGKIICTLS